MAEVATPAEQVVQESQRSRTISNSSTQSASSDMSSPDGRERALSGGSGSGDEHGHRPSLPYSYGRRRTLSQSGASGRVIILALDASDNAKMAMEWYLEQVHRQDDVLVLVHCPETPRLPTFSFKRYLEQIHKPDDYLVLVHCPEAPRLPTFSFKSGMAPPVDEWKKILDEMNARTRKLEEEYEGTCIQRKLRYKVRGEAMKNPGEGIVKIAEDERAEMIVMGTRGLGGVKRALTGSVSDFVVRNASMPVVTVPGKKIRARRQSEAAIMEAQNAAAAQ